MATCVLTDAICAVTDEISLSIFPRPGAIVPFVHTHDTTNEEKARARQVPRRPRASKKTLSVKESLCEGTPGKGVDIGDDRLTASIEQPVLITRCVFHTLLQLPQKESSVNYPA